MLLGAEAQSAVLVTQGWAAAGWYATMPLWPLLGAIVVGLMIAGRAKPERAHIPVVVGVAITALLGVLLFFDINNRRGGHADAGGTEVATSQVAREGHERQGHEAAAVDSSPLQGEGREGVSHGADTHAADEHAQATLPQPLPKREGSHGHAFVNPGLTYTLYNWISLGQTESLEHGHWLAVNFYFDGLTGIMCLFFTVVALMVVLYAVGYMRDHHGHPEPGYERFFAFLGLFVFSMAMLVLAGNFVLLYLGWEAVGLCSYLLIGFYFRKPEAAAAAKKAFIVNRIGDLGFALGIFSIYYFLRGHVQPGENPLDYAVVFKYAHVLAAGDSGIFGWTPATLISLLLMCGALGKSAQFPLYVWLPDAMEGPTPVSALIHAATMVTAGIYMVARCSPIFAASPFALDVILTLGVIGAFLTATMAMAQYDLKRILAYSTISQLAFMFVALGCGVPDSAVFHVFTHAWFKALLFLGAGSVMHAMGGVIDIRRFSGLRGVLPQTFVLMAIGSLALAGFPLLSGFWSKDEIVHAAFNRNLLVGLIMLVTAALTAYYTTRAFCMTFLGPLRLPEEAGEHPHEATGMLRPLWVLALGALFVGYLGTTFPPKSWSDSFLGIGPHGFFHQYLHYSTLVVTRHLHGDIWIAYLSAAVALASIGLAYVRYGTAPREEPDQKLLGPIWNLWNAKYYVDELYAAIFVRPLRGVGHLFFATDRFGVDGLVWLVSALPRGVAFGLHFLQRGALQGYALGMVGGVVVLVLLWSYWT